MQWNFDTTKETKPIVRPSLEAFSGNGTSDVQRVNHISQPSPVAMAPVEAEGPIDMETALDDSPVQSNQRLSNGHTTEEVEPLGESPPLLSSEPSCGPQADDVESSGVDSESDSDGDDDVINDTTEVCAPAANEGGAKHMSALSISEETRALDEALSRSSVISMEDSTTELTTEEGTGREDPTQYEHVGGSSSEDDAQPMETAPEALKPLVSELRLYL